MWVSKTKFHKNFEVTTFFKNGIIILHIFYIIIKEIIYIIFLKIVLNLNSERMVEQVWKIEFLEKSFIIRMKFKIFFKIYLLPCSVLCIRNKMNRWPARYPDQEWLFSLKNYKIKIRFFTVNYGGRFENKNNKFI